MTVNNYIILIMEIIIHHLGLHEWKEFEHQIRLLKDISKLHVKVVHIGKEI